MKIIFLNAYHGELFEPISNFIKTHAEDTDVFCFQEAYENIMRPLCRKLLPGFQEFSYDKEKIGNDFAQATYAKKNIQVISSGTLLEDAANCGAASYIKTQIDGQQLYLCNFHGMPWPGDKLDTPERLQQSQEIIKFFGNKNCPAIIGGDFNLLPDTESIRMFEARDYKNLIQDYQIPTTRNRIAWEKHPGGKQYFADYVFTTADLNITKFHVPQDEVSDHLPMILEFEFEMAKIASSPAKVEAEVV